MQLTGKEIYEIIHDFRDIQQSQFYDLPLNIILALQKNYTMINETYKIIRQTEQIILDRYNYEGYEAEIDALMSESFSVDVVLFSAEEIEGANIPVTTVKTIMLFVEEVSACS